MDAQEWSPVLHGSLETGMKGPKERRQAGSVGVRVSESAGRNAGNA